MIPTLGPTRLRLAPDLRASIAGAWLPYTARISQELPALRDAARGRIGTISTIEVNWRTFSRYPGLDSENSPVLLPLMSITATRCAVTLLVIPPRTASPLAAALLHQAGYPEAAARSNNHSHLVLYAARILQRAADQHDAALAASAGKTSNAART
ncbi:DUF5994 family protein [Gordonia sp. CPCC 205515]|uniref:DUF5994 family protein n=1 Tax=Gordonia sp. CPCC 205515 TaxID=3140791 RepID=UPI003AF38FBA